MTTIINTTKLTGRPVVASCLLASRVELGNVRPIDVRPTEAPAVAATAQAQAYAFAGAAAIADAATGSGRQKKQHLTMWAFRGHEPWRDPA